MTEAVLEWGRPPASPGVWPRPGEPAQRIRAELAVLSNIVRFFYACELKLNGDALSVGPATELFEYGPDEIAPAHPWMLRGARFTAYYSTFGQEILQGLSDGSRQLRMTGAAAGEPPVVPFTTSSTDSFNATVSVCRAHFLPAIDVLPDAPAFVDDWLLRAERAWCAARRAMLTGFNPPLPPLPAQASFQAQYQQVMDNRDQYVFVLGNDAVAQATRALQEMFLQPPAQYDDATMRGTFLTAWALLVHSKLRCGAAATSEAEIGCLYHGPDPEEALAPPGLLPLPGAGAAGDDDGSDESSNEGSDEDGEGGDDMVED